MVCYEGQLPAPSEGFANAFFLALKHCYKLGVSRLEINCFLYLSVGLLKQFSTRALGNWVLNYQKKNHSGNVIWQHY